MRLFRLFLLLIALLFNSALYSQDTLDKKDCSSVSYKNSLLFVRYMNEAKIDSINFVFANWQKHCGLCEPLQRAKIIYSLQNNTYNESILGDSISCNIQYFLDRKHDRYFGNEQYFSYVPINKDFDKFTDSIANGLLRKYPKRSIEYLLCEMYSNTSDSMLIKIKRPLYRNSKIRKNPCNGDESSKNSMKGLRKNGYNIALMSGIWIPTGDFAKMGVHPELGFQGGVKSTKYSIQFTLIVKFLSTPNKYQARRVHTDNTVELTNQFVGPYIGLDYGRTLVSSTHSEFQLLGGLGFDGFTALDPKPNTNGRYEDVRSYNINFGLGYKYYFKNTSYIGIEPKYNIVDYTYNNVLDFTGNFVSIRFVYGHIDGVFDFKKKHKRGH